MSKSTPKADLHTPEELLESAAELFATGNPKMMRAAALEAITALEAYVHSLVFPALTRKFGADFSVWLEDKTRMDFDSRLSAITPIAIGLPIDKGASLWNDYKKAREIRNDIIHKGKKVTQNEAGFVIDTVRKWIAYLGSTIELELALLDLKKYIESKPVSINTELDAISLIKDYFGKSNAAVKIESEVGLRIGKSHLRADLMLQFGSHQIVVETKFSRNRSTQSIVHQGTAQVLSYLKAFGATQAALIIFQKGEIQAGFETVQKLDDGNVYVVVIKV